MQHFKRKSDTLESVLLESSGHSCHTDELCGISNHVLLGTYLPTINLIVFVQTPFKARAKDTAIKQNRQKKRKPVGSQI